MKGETDRGIQDSFEHRNLYHEFQVTRGLMVVMWGLNRAAYQLNTKLLESRVAAFQNRGL